MLFDEIRYFFYITNRRELTQEEVVGLANQRCDQENVIEQLKNGVNAMRMPVDELMSNWAYMVMTALAWNLMVWTAHAQPQAGLGDREDGVSALPSRHRFASGADHPHGKANCLPALKLERMDGGFFPRHRLDRCRPGSGPSPIRWGHGRTDRHIQKRGQNA